ncbi:MAG: hypothetical protein ABIE74_07265 [Pseudomonadota bacterium]
MTIKPFKLKLKKVTERDILWVSSLFELPSHLGLNPTITEDITNIVSRQIGVNMRMELDNYQRETFGALKKRFAHTFFGFSSEMIPDSLDIVTQLDIPFTLMMVERLLGSSKTTFPHPRDLTEIEQGVFQYLILNILSEIHKTLKAKSKTRFLFKKYIIGEQDLSRTFEPDEEMVVLNYRIWVGDNCGFVRILFPFSLIDKVGSVPEEMSEFSEERLQLVEQNLESFGYLNTLIWAEAGRSNVSGADCGGLEEGDVVIFDTSEIDFKDGKPGGNLILRVGDGLALGLLSDFEFAGKNDIKCKIKKLYRGD